MVRSTIAVTGDIKYGRKAIETSAMPKPASPITKLAAKMMPAPATQGRITPARSGARLPPGKEGRHVDARPERKARLPLFQERPDAFAGVVGLPGPEHRQRVQPVRLDGMIDAQQLPHHLPGQSHRDSGGVVGDL